MQLPLAALAALESLVNPLLRQLVAQGGLTAARLDELQGSLFEIRINPWDLQVFIQVSADGFYFHRHLEAPADAWMQASPQALLKLATRSPAEGVHFGSDIQVGGDTARLETLQALVSALGLDAGEILARVAGPLPLASVQAGLQQLLSWGRRTQAAAQRDLKDYLEEETGLLPGQNSLHLLEDELEELRLDVDRLEARLRLLETAARQKTGGTQ